MATLITNYQCAVTAKTHYTKGMDGTKTLAQLAHATKAIHIINKEIIESAMLAIQAMQKSQQEQIQNEKDAQKQKELQRELMAQLNDAYKKEAECERSIELPNEHLKELKEILQKITIESLSTLDVNKNKVKPNTDTVLFLQKFIEDCEKALA